MNEQKVVKFNLYMSCILLVVFILMLVGVTVAYFSDKKEVTNTFTSGNVKIALSESAVKKDSAGNYVADTNTARIFGGTDVVVNNYGKVYPGQTIFKDPTITNTGDDSEWIAAKVILTDGVGDLTKVMGYEGYEDIDIEILLSGGLLDETVHFGTWNGINDVCYNDHYAMIQIPDATEGKFEFIFLMLQPIESGDSVIVFDHVKIPGQWNNAEMQQLVDLKIHVQAFGVQTLELDNCLEAMTEAFPDHFNIN